MLPKYRPVGEIDPDIFVLMAESVVLDEQFQVMFEEDPSFAESVRRRACGPSYRTTCRTCGALLLALEAGPASPPWICDGCGAAFWTSQLTDVARDGTDPDSVDRAVEDEQAEAIRRGVSLRPDQLRLVTADELPCVLLRYGDLLDAAFAAAIIAEFGRRS